MQVSTPHFIEAFHRIRNQFGTNRTTYEHLEELHILWLGTRKFSDYDSFRKILARQSSIKKKK